MSTLDYYIIEGHEPKAVDQDAWLEWAMQAPLDAFDERKRVAQSQVGEAEVSTVFLTMDHNWADEGPPVLFETMIFGGPHDQYTERYTTWDEARAGHDRVVRNLEAGLDPDAPPPPGRSG